MRKLSTLSQQRAWLPLILVLAVALAGCQASSTPAAPTGAGEPTASSPQQTTEPASATVEATPTARPEEPTLAPPTATATPAPTATPAATLTPTATAAPKSIQQTDNLLVLGMDQRPGELGWRTDTIIVVALDYDAKRVGLISIPRDLWVEIPGYGMGRINQVDVQGEQQKYPGGGPALVQKVISDTLGITTKHWVRLRLEALPELVDALGGVTVTLDCPLHELTPDPAAPESGRFEHFDLPAGEVFLDGENAAKFARYRYASNDFSRAQRQQQLIWAIRERALEINILPKIPDLWKALSKTFKTDLTLLDIIRLARFGSELSASQVHGVTFSKAAMSDAQVGPAWVVKMVDEKQVQREINSLFEAKPIAEQGRDGSGGCPAPVPMPSVAPSNSEAVTPTPTP